MTLELRVDRSLCKGSGSCVRRAPALFSLDEQRKAVPRTPTAAQQALALEVARACPFFAIALWRDGERVD